MTVHKLKALPAAEDLEARDRRQAEAFRNLEMDIRHVQVMAFAAREALFAVGGIMPKEEKLMRLDVCLLLTDQLSDHIERLHRNYHATA